jgi:hypothetical protein
MADSFDLLKKARKGKKFEEKETKGESFRKDIKKLKKPKKQEKMKDNMMDFEKNLENDPRSNPDLYLAKGGRAMYKSGMRVCKLAKRGKGRAYGKNS